MHGDTHHANEIEKNTHTTFSLEQSLALEIKDRVLHKGMVVSLEKTSDYLEII